MKLLGLLKSYLEDKTGIAAVEFALLFPPLVLMMVGAIDFGVYMNHKMKVENAARAAVEYVVQGGHINNITSDVITAENLNLSDDELEFLDIDAAYVCECEDGIYKSCSSETPQCTSDGDYLRRFIEVTVSYQYEPIAPYPGLPESMNIAGHVRVHMP